jgi:hypothetical protein
MTMHQRSEPVFQVYYTYRPERAFAWQASIALLAYLVLKVATRGSSHLESLPMLGIALSVVLIFCALDMLSYFWHHWPYTEWAADRRTYLQLDEAEITLLGETTLSWSEIAEVRSVTVPGGTQQSPRTFLILVLSDIRARFRHPGEAVDRLQGDNASILRWEAGRRMNLTEHAFLSLAIAAPMGGPMAAHLSATSDEIVQEAKRRLLLVQRRQQAASSESDVSA